MSGSTNMQVFDVYYANVKYVDDKNISKYRPIVYIVASDDNKSKVYKITSIKHPELSQYQIKDLEAAGLNKESYIDLEHTFILNNEDIESNKLRGHLSNIDIGGLTDKVISNNILNNIADLTKESLEEDKEDNMLFQDYLRDCLKDDEFKKYYSEESLGEDMEEDTRLILDEPEDELPEVQLEEPLEVEAKAEDLDNALISQYNNEITNIYSDIDLLNSLLISFENMSDEAKDTLNSIIDDRYYHIGLIQSLVNEMNPKIKELISTEEIEDKIELEEPEE